MQGAKREGAKCSCLPRLEHPSILVLADQVIFRMSKGQGRFSILVKLRRDYAYWKLHPIAARMVHVVVLTYGTIIIHHATSMRPVSRHILYYLMIDAISSILGCEKYACILVSWRSCSPGAPMPLSPMRSPRWRQMLKHANGRLIETKLIHSPEPLLCASRATASCSQTSRFIPTGPVV